MTGVEFITVAAAAITVTGGLAVIGRKAWRGLRRATQFLDDYEGTPARPGVPERPGVMRRLELADEANRETARVSKETAASVERLARGLGNQGVLFAEHSQILDAIRADVDAIKAEMPKNGVPLAHKIDALWADRQARIAASDQAVTVAAAAVSVSPAPPPAAPHRPLEPRRRARPAPTKGTP